MKRNQLSILIPLYNGDCRAMVEELCTQASDMEGLDYEVIVADDGSSDRAAVECCREVEYLPHCRFIAREENVGRAAIRNFLARQATKEWLLFLDCDMSIISARFLSAYLEADGDVVYGGYRVGDAPRSCLRWLYEKASEPEHTAERRRQRPYQHFHTANFLVRRDIMLAHPFDESFRRYGYEDVLFGKQLRQASIPITHINNPTGFLKFEDNSRFVAKTEEGLQTLLQHREQLRGYSQLLTFVDGIHVGLVRFAIRLWHRCAGRLERRQLCGSSPSLRLFSLYKLGYFLSLEKEKTADTEKIS